jgi:aspartyl-tRNA(Asn)/glutamyl-tRNA(Gln) amidotransferase subunit B
LPGTLPVLNREAVQLAIRAGLALNAEIAENSYFERKHYFYPDLPKGYQITQLAHPTIGAGSVTIHLEDGSDKVVRIHHAHIEEDAGKLTHPNGVDYSLVDLNRAGTPLIEIVSEPDMHSASEAKAYAQEIYLLMTYVDVTYGDLYHGNIRFDVNVSVGPIGAPLGTRTETKNLNSFQAVERAVDFEINRQVKLLDKDERVVQETRGWNEDRQATFSQRSKEDAHDYRYFPDADLPPVKIEHSEVEIVAKIMPKLPEQYRQEFNALGLDSSVVTALLGVKSNAEIVADVNKTAGQEAASRVAHWLSSALGSSEEQVDASTLGTNRLIELSSMVDSAELNSTAAKEVLISMLSSSDSPRQIAEQKNLIQVSDELVIAKIVDEIITDPANQKAVEDIQNGNEKVIGYLVGLIMKESKGKVNPGLVQKLIRERLL